MENKSRQKTLVGAIIAVILTSYLVEKLKLIVISLAQVKV